jgi:hypothetical protein
MVKQEDAQLPGPMQILVRLENSRRVSQRSTESAYERGSSSEASGLKPKALIGIQDANTQIREGVQDIRNFFSGSLPDQEYSDPQYTSTIYINRAI